MAQPKQTPKTPIDFLLPYQRKFALDDSRFKIANWSRQVGKSTATAEEAVRDAITNVVPQDWICLSAGERQSGEWLSKAKQWAECYGIWAQGTPYEDLTKYTDNASEIIFGRGSRIIALPANPKTARGYSANLVLDEFAWHERPDEIYAAIYPSISNPLKGLKKVRVVSTPNGRNNMFYRLFTDIDNNYSKSLITIYDATKQGLQFDVNELRKGVPDNDMWEQEYLCIFNDTYSVLLSYEIITEAERDEHNTPYIPPGTPLYIGIDVGRKRDKTSIVTLADLDGLLVIVDVIDLDNMPYDDQLKVIMDKAVGNVQGVAIDATGIGSGLAESLANKLGGICEPVTFNNTNKNEMCAQLKRVFESRQIIIPSGARYRDDLHSITKKVSPGGTITYTAARTSDGHSDFASALMLGVKTYQDNRCDENIVMPFSFR